jgi:hypothetical protein
MAKGNIGEDFDEDEDKIFSNQLISRRTHSIRLPQPKFTSTISNPSQIRDAHDEGVSTRERRLPKQHKDVIIIGE